MAKQRNTSIIKHRNWIKLFKKLFNITTQPVIKPKWLIYSRKNFFRWRKIIMKIYWFVSSFVHHHQIQFNSMQTNKKKLSFGMEEINQGFDYIFTSLFLVWIGKQNLFIQEWFITLRFDLLIVLFFQWYSIIDYHLLWLARSCSLYWPVRFICLQGQIWFGQFRLVSV